MSANADRLKKKEKMQRKQKKGLFDINNTTCRQSRVKGCRCGLNGTSN